MIPESELQDIINDIEREQEEIRKSKEAAQQTAIELEQAR